MSRSARKIIEEALHLDEGERADVAGALIESLDGPTEPGAAEAWERVIERRVRALEAGTARTVVWRPVAGREPKAAPDLETGDRLTRLERQGVIRRASQRVGPALLGPPPPRLPGSVSVLAALLEDRHGGR